MQFLPSSPLEFTTAAAPFTEQVANALDNAGENSSFKNVLSSFIEEGREDYTGLPPGFEALERESGTLDRKRAELLQNALKKRGVQEASLETIDQLLASSAPMTVGRMFAALSGTSRVSPELEGQERLDFRQIMQKLGFNADEAEELLGLADKGASAAVWRRINGKLGDVEQMEVHGEELSALLKGLDLSEGVQKQIQKLLSEGQSATISGKQLEAMLAEAGRELAAKDLAAAGVQKQMRAAMEEALNEAKLNKKADPSADAKGTRLSDYSESMMQSTVNKKIDAGLGDTAGRNASDKETPHREDPGFVRDGMGRAERILSKNAPEPEASPVRKPSAEHILNRMVERMDSAASLQAAPQTNASPAGTPMAETAGRYSREIFSQVENGMLNTFANGGGRLTLQLNPQELGQVNLMLSVHNGEVRATIRAESAESAAVLSEQLQQLKTSLEEAGLKVAELEVQTGLQDNFNSGHWDGAEQHNLMRDAEERARMRRLAEIRRDASPAEAGRTTITTHAGREGLHIVA